MFSMVSQTKDSRLSPLRHGSSGKGMGEGLCEVLGSSPNGDKNLPIKKKEILNYHFFSPFPSTFYIKIEPKEQLTII